jgi:hypothetical protein
MLRADLCKGSIHLVPADFRAHPVWTWCGEESESLVCPLELGDNTIDEIEYDAVFIHADFILGDATREDGAIGVNPYRKMVYLLMFFRNGKIVDCLLGHGPGEANLQELARRLGRPISAVSPVSYTTPYSYASGGRIEGVVDLLG